jgi:hypothetical protein
MSKETTIAAGSTSASADRSAGWFRAGIVCLVLSLAFYRTSQTIADPDLWGHVKFGQDILRARAIPTVDRYSYLTEGYPYREWEWLSKAAIAAIFDLGGAPGLIVFKTVVSLLMLALLYRHLSVHGLDALRSGMVILVVTFLLLPGVTTVRVHLFTYICFLILLLVVHAAERGRRAWLLVLPPLCALWANLHPGVLAGLAVLWVWCAVHLAAQVVQTRRARALLEPPGVWLLLAVVACSLATLLNPFGIHLLILMAVNVPAPRPEITEFQPIRILSLEGLAYLLLLGACVAGFLCTRRKRSPALVAVFAGMALAPLLAIRHVPLFALAAVVLAGEHLADAWQRWSVGHDSPGERDSLAGQRTRLSAGCFVAAAALVFLGLPHLLCIRMDPQQPFPARAVALLKDSGVRGNVAVFFDWGDYVLWYLSPEVRVSVDGRRESTYSEEVYAENMSFLYGTSAWDKLIEQHPSHPTDLVLLRKDFPVYNLMKLKGKWELVYEDAYCAIFVPRGSAQGERIRAMAPRTDIPENGAGLCFPGP